MDAPVAALVGRLAGVLLEVGPLDADAGAVGQLEPAVDVERLVVLADLVVLRHVRVEVVLPGEHARRTSQCSARPTRMPSSTAAWLSTGSEPGRPSVTGSMLVLGSPPNWLGARAEHLGARGQLGVDLEADDDLPARGVGSGAAAVAPVDRALVGRCRCRRHGAAASSTAAACSNSASERRGEQLHARRAGRRRPCRRAPTRPGGPTGWWGSCTRR